jgi:HlyD family secretion protein
VSSTTANGLVEALTKVDVKSRAGGEIVELLVEEGDFVRPGDLIAVIDRRDNEANRDRAAAQRDADLARARSAEVTVALEERANNTELAAAENDLRAARIRLERAEIQARTQPAISDAAVNSARANLRAAEEDLQRFDSVEAPLIRRETQGEVERTRTALEVARRNVDRQRELVEKGFAAASALDQAEAQLAAANTSFQIAQQRLSTLDREIQSQRQSRQLAVDRARTALDEALANTASVSVQQKNLEEARTSLRQAEVAVQRARDNQRRIQQQKLNADASRATVRQSEVQLRNAQLQLDQTRVVAPRAGVVTAKYLEEGSIIPAATSAFAEGTSIVQLSDVNELFIVCPVDENDVSGVKVGQQVRIIIEAFPRARVKGVVERISPAANTVNNITTIPVRVRITEEDKAQIKPGMTATCEFITLKRENVLYVPSQAVRTEDGKTYVLVKTGETTPPAIRFVEVGARGNDSTEILSGLQEGEEVVVAEINLAELRQTQQRMMEAQQGGGLTGGGRR